MSESNFFLTRFEAKYQAILYLVVGRQLRCLLGLGKCL